MNPRNNQMGFLLISILLVILILGLLMGGAYFNRINRAKEIKESSSKQIESIEKHLEEQTKGLETQIKSLEENNIER
jgi:type II secretory pathway pseudopilin PulG